MTELPSPADSAAPVDQRSPFPTPSALIGRSAELARLLAALQSAEAGHGSTIILAGESGIGKTRLANALLESATKRNVVVAVGRAYPVETGVPYAVFSDALLPLL